MADRNGSKTKCHVTDHMTMEDNNNPDGKLDEGATNPPESFARSELPTNFDQHRRANSWRARRSNNGYTSFDSSISTPPVHSSMAGLDIVGQTAERRFPWQHDVGVQCSIMRWVPRRAESVEVPDKCTQRGDRAGMGAGESWREPNRLSDANRLSDPSRVFAQYFSDIGYNVPLISGCYDDEVIGRRRNALPELSHVTKGQHSEGRERFSSDNMTSWTSTTVRSRPKVKRTDSAPIPRTPSFDDIPGFTNAVSDNQTSLDLGGRSDTLLSPRVSPVPWLTQDVPDLVVTSLHGDYAPADDSEIQDNFLTVPKQKPLRRKSSGSLQSTSDDSDTDTSPPLPPVSRRGRRKAICDSKSLGLAPDGDTSPSNSCDESEASCHSTKPRKRSSGDLGINYPGDLLVHGRQKKVLIKRNTIADFANTKAYQASTASLISEQESSKKKQTSSFSLLKLIGDKKSSRTKESSANLSDVLSHIKPSEFKDSNLTCYKDLHWSELIASKDKDGGCLMVSDHERKRREAVWELFKSECVFLVDHLMVLKHCFMEPLKKVQVEGCLMFAEPQDLFGNLDELCYVSYTFCRDFISLLLKDATSTNFGRTEVLVMALQRFSQLTRDGEVYHDYCLNYSKAVTYLEQLRKNDDFTTFEKWCESDMRCHRLQLTDLLISPMQHCTKVPLLLTNIRKYTEDPEERMQLTEVLEKLDSSLRNLENKMKWLKNFERVQEIQQQLIWQPITELEPRAFIPEFLKSTLLKQPCERLLASPKRQLLYEGPLTLLEINKTVNMYMLLFDDILLLTRVRQPPRKLSKALPSQENNPTDGAIFVVHRQPIALDRFTIHDVRPPDAVASGLKNAFVLVQISRFQQIIGVYTLQAPTETAKAAWLSHLHEAQKQYKAATHRQGSTSSGSFSFDASFSYAEDVTADAAFVPCGTGSKQSGTREGKTKGEHLDRAESDRYSSWNKSLDESAFGREAHQQANGNTEGVQVKGHPAQNTGHPDEERKSTEPSQRGLERLSTRDEAEARETAEVTSPGACAVSEKIVISPPLLSPDQSHDAETQAGGEREIETESRDIPRSPTSSRHGSPLNRAQKLNILKVIHEKSHSKELMDVLDPVYI